MASRKTAVGAEPPDDEHRCPHCGYCPHCGRSDAQKLAPIPYPMPYPVPWPRPAIPQPWQYPSYPGTFRPYITCGSTSGAQISGGSYTQIYNGGLH